MDGCWESGSRNAQEDVHPPRLALHGGAVDAESRLFSQTQTDQQYLG